MSFFKCLTRVLAVVFLIALAAPVEAKPNKGDKYFAEGRIHEAKKEWDDAVKSYEQALSEDPANLVYQMATEKARFQAAQEHIDKGLKLRSQGQLGDALLEFQKAYATSPSSAAVQETQLTRSMIERERTRTAATGREASRQQRALTPLEEYKKDEREQLNRILSVPRLRPLNTERLNLKMNNKAKVLFETVAKYAGLNVLWDPEFTPPAKDGFNIELQDATVEQALDYLAVLTKSYWKAMSPNTIFITMDNPNKRRDYEEWVTKTFYLQNVQTQQELQEVVNAVRTITDISKIYQFLGQNALVVRGESDKVELASKIISDLDKPKSEVVVDVLVIEATSTFSRQLTAALASTGLNVPVNFSPRTSIQAASSTSTTTSTTTTTTTSSTSTPTYIPLSSVGHLSSADFATTLPSALLEAVMSDAKTRILQAPQLRSVDNAKATLNIGEREPTATGAYQSGVSGVAVSSLVNTQFTYIDVGVNVELTPRVHDDGDVSMHIKVDISSVTGTVSLSGINEPIIGQRKVEHDIRMREGEVGLLGGLVTTEDDKTITGVPGLDKVPFLRRLFTGDSTSHNRDELMIVLIPHIIRRPEINAENLRPIATGSQLAVKLAHEARPAEVVVAATAKPAEANTPAVPAGGLPATAPALTASAAPPSTGSAAQDAPRVHFAPSQLEASLGGTVTVSLVIDGATDVASVPATIFWDPSVLTLNGIDAGDLFTESGRHPAVTKDIHNDQGRATVEAAVPANTPGVTASTGTLLTFSFQAVGRGTTHVTVPQLKVNNSHAGLIAGGSPQLTVDVK